MKQRVRDIVEQGDRLFTKRAGAGVDQLWQTTAENFYPIRADFTTQRVAGDEFASHLMTGRPVLAHRELANAIGAMLRPRGVAWFRPRTDSDELNNNPIATKWLDAKGDVMRTKMYAHGSQFVRTSKQGDNDFIAFGQAVMEVTANMYRSGVLYRPWHLRDTVWCENAELQIDTVHRNWKMEARAMVARFGRTVDPKVRELIEKEPYKEIKCRHVVLPADQYDLAKPDNRRLPFVSLYVDCENDTILEELPYKRLGYVIPRWVTNSGTQYAYSPSTIASIPDARLIQAINLTLLEAGQKAVDPPLKATREAVVGGVNTYAGGLTWVDYEYDERFGAALEPLMQQNLSGLAWGEKREEKIERLIAEAFFLNVINLPENLGGDKMTAYETKQRVEEYIRRALPLFEPMEVEFNGEMCENTWQVLMDLGAFGSFQDMPPILSKREIKWQFESPLQSSNDRLKSEAFREASMLLKEAAALEPSTRRVLDIDTAFRDALAGVAPAKWIVPVERAAELQAQDAKRQAQAQQLQNLSAGAGVASQITDALGGAGEAVSAIREAAAPQAAA